MRIVIMQPYFVPYLGYFDLANRADCWIAFDTAQYIRHGWVNRNRVLHPNGGWQYILVPLKQHSHTAAINQVEIAEPDGWQANLLKRLDHYRGEAPFFEEVTSFLLDAFGRGEKNLARLNLKVFKAVCERLGIRKTIHALSELDPDLPKGITGANNWGIQISRAVGATELINAPGGAAFLDPTAFASQGIKLTIQDFVQMSYRCGRYRFEPGLSIVDVMMWNSPQHIKDYLDTFDSRPSGQDTSKEAPPERVLPGGRPEGLGRNRTRPGLTA